MAPISFTIRGEPASKANSRKIVTVGAKFGLSEDGQRTRIGGRFAVVKSQKALTYARDFRAQLPQAAKLMLEGPIAVRITIWYASNRPDLDESLILDLLQPVYRKVAGAQKRVMTDKGVIVNDRQIVERHVLKRIDRANPRAEITITPIAEPGSADLFSTADPLDPFP